MKPRRLKAIVQEPEACRFRVLAEGTKLLAENVATLEADATTLSTSRRDCGAAMLRCFAEEEAAKVLILLDIARAGWKDQIAVSASLSSFYTHLARGLYVRAYDGTPADLAEVRGHVDHFRQQFYLDGPMDVDWIFSNEVLASREERLYVDYIEDEHGNRHWTGPADRTAMLDAPFSLPAQASRVVRLVAAMRRIGLLTEQGFAATRTVWDGVAVDDAMHWSDLRPRNVTVVEQLAVLLGRAYATEEDLKALHYVVEHWIFPLTSLDLTQAKVDPTALKDERERWLAHQTGGYDF